MPLHNTDSNITNEKITFIKSHLDEVHIVADFDGTLTQYFDHNGKSRPSIISLLYNEGILDDDYTQQAQAMQKHYITIEHDERLSLKERQSAMEERWTKHKELLIQKGLNIKNIQDITSMDRIVMRPGVDSLLHKAHAANIPFIVFSASGIGVDSISMLLQHRRLLLPNISIVSNKLYRDESGNMIGYSKPVIHSLNKTESVIQESKEYDSIKEAIRKKPHAIILGDGIGDADMVDQKEGITLLKIGLCNDKVEDRIASYEKVFDIVITHDDSLEEITTMILV